MSASLHHPPPEASAGAVPPPPPDHQEPQEPQETQETQGARPGSAAGPVGWAVALIGAGVLWLVHLAGVPIDWQLVLPIAIVAIGLMVLVGGRRVARSGLVGLGIVLTAITLLVSVTPVPTSMTAGDRSYTLTDLADLEPHYGIGAGTLTLDLRDLDLPPGTTEIDASVWMGELVVRVPDDATVTGTGHAIAGEVVSFGQTTGGIVPRRILDEAGAEDGPALELELRVGLGRIEVTR